MKWTNMRLWASDFSCKFSKNILLLAGNLMEKDTLEWNEMNEMGQTFLILASMSSLIKSLCHNVIYDNIMDTMVKSPQIFISWPMEPNQNWQKFQNQQITIFKWLNKWTGIRNKHIKTENIIYGNIAFMRKWEIRSVMVNIHVCIPYTKFKRVSRMFSYNLIPKCKYCF